ncbi:MAG: D-alanyl-D-alanine carboxypeptidase [Desulfobacterales bacterium]|nr:D-alanyl-D-alanine carboxypeptidase [Desulfobacterales bacterium]MDP6808005.1 D-alanyl-D-alanine carboxypeptidase [Desulfobacterales bacterium]
MIFLWIFYLFYPKSLIAGNLSSLSHLIGNQDAILVGDPEGRVIFSKNVQKKLTPASILKIFTALVAFHFLGEDHRFNTDFYLDRDSNLKVKGYGDPLLLSEILDEISEILITKFVSIRDIVLDDTYFQHPIVIPGITSSFEPYDAPNGALCVNFNTVNFKRKNNSYVSAEPQTPLLPFVLPRIRQSALDRGRIILSNEKKEVTRYTGRLLQYFLEKKKVKARGKIKIGRVRKEKDTLIFKYVSRYTLKHIVAELMEYSNNFIANQILIASGVKLDPPGGTLKKGVQAGYFFAKKILKIDDFSFVEGSGISRKNKISADSMYKVLKKFKSYHYLMRHTDREFYKTGSLKGIRTRAGYIRSRKGGLYSFVVMINTPGKTTSSIMASLLAALG